MDIVTLDLLLSGVIWMEEFMDLVWCYPPCAATTILPLFVVGFQMRPSIHESLMLDQIFFPGRFMLHGKLSQLLEEAMTFP